VYGEAKP